MVRKRESTRFQILMDIEHEPIQNVICFMRSTNLLAKTMKCSVCLYEMAERTIKTGDNTSWICRNRRCSSYRNTMSIRKNSFFDGFKQPLADMFMMMVLWSRGRQLRDIIIEYNFKKNTLIRINNMIRLAVLDYYECNPVKLGGPGIICQIDESQFTHKDKSDDDEEPSEDLWVFGIADTSFSPAKCYMEIVPNRKAKTLLPIIKRVCLPGTTIHSDESAAYRTITKDLGFKHVSVNHSRHFVCPKTGAHLQHIESYWNKMKSNIKKLNGISKNQLPGIITELMFKDMFKEDAIIELIRILKVE